MIDVADKEVSKAVNTLEQPSPTNTELGSPQSPRKPIKSILSNKQVPMLETIKQSQLEADPVEEANSSSVTGDKSGGGNELNLESVQSI